MNEVRPETSEESKAVEAFLKGFRAGNPNHTEPAPEPEGQQFNVDVKVEFHINSDVELSPAETTYFSYHALLLALRNHANELEYTLDDVLVDVEDTFGEDDA